MNQRTERLFSVLIGVIIITYGVMGPNLFPTYQVVVEKALGSEIIKELQPLFSGTLNEAKDQYNLGKYLIYYPSYIVLHLSLISLLFWNAPKSRRIGIMFILIGLPLLAGIVFAFYLLGWRTFYQATFVTFINFVAYPFILFVVEGGRLLDKDIDRLIYKSDKSNQ